jgi:hypothetical protein
MSADSGNKITPLGGKHKSASSLLAEIMNDPAAKRVVVFTFDGEGTMRLASAAPVRKWPTRA